MSGPQLHRGLWHHSSKSGKSLISRHACSSSVSQVCLFPSSSHDLPRASPEARTSPGTPSEILFLSNWSLLTWTPTYTCQNLFLIWACGVTSENCTPEGVLLPQTNEIKRDAPILLLHLLNITKLLGIYPRESITCAHRKPRHQCSQQHYSRYLQSEKLPTVYQLVNGHAKCGPSMS